jgi:penicillin-binding protein 1A
MKQRSAKKPTRTELSGGWLWRARRWLFALFLVGASAVAVGLYLLTRVPLPNAHPLQQTTFVYDSTGQVLATFSEQNRVPVTLRQVPQTAINAVVSTEDRHFFTEGAVNPVSIVRAAISDVFGSGGLQGGSTITQQYVKQTYLSSERSITRKLKEAALAIRLSRTESKDEILQNYLNTIYWGRGAYGIQAAARAYFGVDVGKLTLPESSLLAGMIRNPDGSDPSRHAAQARQSQADTLRAMVRDGQITEGEAEAAEAVPFTKYVISPSASTGVVTSTATGDQYFIEAVREQLYAKYGQQMVDGGGLRVTTTLDPTLQAEGYNAVYGHNALNPAAGGPSGALVSVDDKGQVKALVGGQDYAHGSTVDLALGTAGGGSGRQAGSTFKAFMLAEVLKLGYSPLSVFPAPPEVVLPHGNANGTPWDVTNFEGEATEPMLSLVDATAHSVNTVYAQVVDRIGPANLVSMAEQLGIKPSELGAYPSLVLGTAPVSPLEMAAAYATFADNGVYHAPLLVSRVTTASGQALPLPVQPTSQVVLTPTEAAEETYVLQQVIFGGTGGLAGAVGSPIAGKTGTTENSADAWFIGYTSKLTTALWMGYASGSRPMVGVQGGSIPAELWHNFMVAALASEPQWGGQFPVVYNLTGATLTPPSASSLLFPKGMGITTTTSTTSTSTTSTSVPKTTTTTTKSSVTSPPPSTVPGSTSPPTTVHAPPASTASQTSTTLSGR